MSVVNYMARKSTIPDEILQHKPCKCCRIQKNNGTYYVYKYSSVKLSDGNWSSDWGYCIGKIIPGSGFSPNKRYLKELDEQNETVFSDSITDAAYGQYALLQTLSQDIRRKLYKCFPARRAQFRPRPSQGRCLPYGQGASWRRRRSPPIRRAGCSPRRCG